MDKLNLFKEHQCLIHGTAKKKRSSIYKLKMSYLFQLKQLKYYLYRKNEKFWKVAACVIVALLSEPFTNVKIGFYHYLLRWKKQSKKYGFFDAGDPHSLNDLRDALKTSDPSEPPPVILLHGLAASPNIWMLWAHKLREAREAKKIGHIISLQLPNDMDQRMELVYKAIDDVTEIYKEASLEGVVDLVGHSLGGYSAHLAAFEKDLVRERLFMTERCQKPGLDGPRNKKVRKVISVAAPKRVFPDCKFPEVDHPLNHFIVDHDHIFDIVATEDVICPSISHLEPKQVYTVQHGHLGIIICTKVCQLAADILSKKSNN